MITKPEGGAPLRLENNGEPGDRRAARALSACDMHIEYRLGKGGMKPNDPVPHDSEQGCDCSGFVAWVLGISRQCARIPGGWIETTLVWKDARGTRKVFEQVSTPMPGDLIVYPDKSYTVTEGGQRTRKTRQGHIGVVTRVAGGKVTRVVHCSAGNFRRTGRAVQETDAKVFVDHGAICVRYKEPAE